MATITLEELNKYHEYFNSLKKSKIEFSIVKKEEYVCGDDPHYAVTLHPQFLVRNIDELTHIWTAAPQIINNSCISTTGDWFDTYAHDGSVIAVHGAMHAKNYASIKYFASEVLCKEKTKISVYLINSDVFEVNSKGNTIRYCATSGVGTRRDIVFCGNQDTPWFNYIDTGHIIVYVSGTTYGNSETRMFVTDCLTLDMNYVIAAASVYPAALDLVLQNKAYIPSKDCRLALLKMEKSIPAKYRDSYLAIKRNIQEHFNKNTANVMIGKLTRNESPFIDLNSIRITSNRAEYAAGNISIEASNLAEVIFTKLNPNEAEWDIFTLINIYTDWVNNRFSGMALNPSGAGFREVQTFEFSINDIPLKVSCNTVNTRRSINGHLINVDELSAVLKRASCYQVPRDTDDTNNVRDYDRFLTNVSRYSLKIRDIWSNGLPVKTVFTQNDREYRRKAPATNKHPKLRFVLKDKKGFYLQVKHYDPSDKTKVIKTNEYRIGKFAEFIQKVEKLNDHTHMAHYSYYMLNSDGVYIPKNSNTKSGCGDGLIALLTVYAPDITQEDKKAIVGNINYELSEAEKRSEELLNEACEITQTIRGIRADKPGFIVPGKMRSYFVEEEAPYKVWDNDASSTNPYFCVVDKGDQGVGKDALVSRIFALHNDEMMVKHISTLKR
jgi:hypothetical protein